MRYQLTAIFTRPWCPNGLSLRLIDASRRAKTLCVAKTSHQVEGILGESAGTLLCGVVITPHRQQVIQRVVPPHA